MADISQIFYSGIREQVKRVVGLLGEERTEKGLKAFTNGSSTWSHCFFAQALAPEHELHSENDVARILGLVNADGRLNLVPVRIVYHTFDRMSSMISKQQLAQLIRDLLDEYRRENAIPELPDTSSTIKMVSKRLTESSTLMDVLKKIDYTGVAKKKLTFEGPSCAT
jgi:hypothetical protein